MLEQVFHFISFHPEISIVGALTLIQIAPIKMDPWSAIAGWIKKLLIGSLEEKIDVISRKVSELEEKAKEDRAYAARNRILRFADELYNGNHHSKEYFDEILSDIDFYEKYCDLHPKFKNNKAVMSVDLIKKVYAQLMEEHKF